MFATFQFRFTYAILKLE